ncbi:MAG: homocysteine S-methyltransferase family protein [Coriobacteriia bacterium]|nr:homocysteine S-methyltransferase family protein [Coriobacteriia bacterium]
MNDLRADLGRTMLVLEGAMGTPIQRGGFTDVMPEQLNLLEPDYITQVHRNYVLAGADVAESNSFGASRPKLAEFGLEDSLEVINQQAVKLARKAGPRYVLGDIGPSGLVLEPLGKTSFDELFEIFAEQARALASADPDGFILETFTDIAEARCALLACKEVAPELPALVSVALGEAGRMELSGTDSATAAIILEAAGADMVGLNCSLGPAEMAPHAKRMLRATRLPVFASPNAGIPCLDEFGETVYPATPEDYGRFAAELYEAGAAMIGGCCGATVAYIGAIADEISGRPVAEIECRAASRLVVAGPRRATVIGGWDIDENKTEAGGDLSQITPPLRMIGERINPTGKRELRESLQAGNFSVARDYAAAQAEAGADLLDVNVGAPGIDAAEVLPRLVLALSASCDVPLCIDTTDPVALERALRVYPGKALINSVNGEADSMEAILPLAARYGAALVVLALDGEGIPATAEARLAVVGNVRDQATELGIAAKDLLVDSLVMAAAADHDAPTVTLDTMRAVREKLGLATLLGVSNVSHGLPGRPTLNAAFLAAAAADGLDAGIVNPNDPVMGEAISTINAARAAGQEPDSVAAREQLEVLLARALDPQAALDPDKGSGTLSSTDKVPDPLSPEMALARAITRGDSDGAPAYVDALMAAGGWTPERIIAEVLTPAIQELGEGFGRGDVFLPQLMVAADAMKAATDQAKTYLSAADRDAAIRGHVVFATVKGDIHSIGKDICISLLESQGFVCNDLGVDVTTERVLEAARDADVVCLSALMTTTMPAMEATAHAVTEQCNIPVLVGGAVVTGGWARGIGAGYGANATACVKAVEQAICLVAPVDDKTVPHDKVPDPLSYDAEDPQEDPT